MKQTPILITDKNEKMWLGIVLLVFGFVFLTSWVGITGLFVPQSKAIKALESQGFSRVTITHRAWFAVSFRGGEKRDAVRFTAEAVNPAGKKVTVYVFSGWLFKGATIRTP